MGDIAGSQKTAAYYYVPESDLIERVEIGSGMTNDIVTTYGYEPERNLKTLVKNEFPGIANPLISQYKYTYDDIGRRSDVKNTGIAFSQDAFSKYDYNICSELTGSYRYLGTDTENTGMPVDPETRIYTYDNIGNRKTATEHTLLQTYDADELNRYNQITSGAQTENPAYDDDGNMTANSGKKYMYNAENRLISSEPEIKDSGGKKVEFVYDYMGRRVKKTVSVWDGSFWASEAEKLFFYDGWNMIYEITIPDGQPAAEKYFAWGLDLSQSVQGAGGIGGLLATLDKSSSVVYYYLYDANGNAGQLISTADGSIAAHYEYDPFGNVTFSYGTEADNNVYRFSTKFFDTVTGLYYYGFRYLSTDLGRWLNRDPIGEQGGFNLYVFVLNNPELFADPFGNEYSKRGGLSPYDIDYGGPGSWAPPPNPPNPDNRRRIGPEVVVYRLYIGLVDCADYFNNLIIYPVLDILAIPNETIKKVTGYTDEELIGITTSTPYPADDYVATVIAGLDKIPKITRMLFGKIKLSQVKALRDFGVNSAGRRAFFKGKVVQGGFTTKKGATVDAFLHLEKNDKLTAQLFYIENRGQYKGAGAKALIYFKNQTIKLAKSLGVNKVEIQGGSVINPDIKKFLNKYGFKKKTIAVPEALGGGSEEVLYKIINVE